MKEMVNPLPCYSCTMMTFGSLFGLGSLPLVASVNAKQLLFLFFFSFSLFFFFFSNTGKRNYLNFMFFTFISWENRRYGFELFNFIKPLYSVWLKSIKIVNTMAIILTERFQLKK